MDQLLQLARVLRLVGRRARHHFVQRHAHRPQIRVTIHLAAAQPLRRAIAGAAQIQMRPAVRERERLGDSEIQQAHFVVGADLNVRRLDVAVHHRSLRCAVDLGLERMQLVELAQDLRSRISPARAGSMRFSCFQNLGDGPALDVLHGDEETSIQFARLVNLDDARIGLVQLLLDVARRGARLRRINCVSGSGDSSTIFNTAWRLALVSNARYTSVMPRASLRMIS